MAQKEFINTKLVAQMTTEVLMKVMKRENLSLRQVAEQLPQAYSFVWSRLNGTK